MFNTIQKLTEYTNEKYKSFEITALNIEDTDQSDFGLLTGKFILDDDEDVMYISRLTRMNSEDFKMYFEQLDEMAKYRTPNHVR